MSLLTLVGMRFRPPADKIVPMLDTGTPVILVREPQNKHDPNAIAVYLHLGYVSAKQAASLGPDIDEAKRLLVAEGHPSATGHLNGRLIQTPSWPSIDIDPPQDDNS